MSDAEKSPSRYVVGIDLGTTNSAASYVDTTESPWQLRTFVVPQHVAVAQLERRDTLPSFHYEPAANELPQGALQLPWTGKGKSSGEKHPAYTVGFFARDQGALTPGRLIASAKSWLCHTGVDRNAALLPWHGAADVTRLSPVEVSARYLEHFRRAWDFQFPDHPLAEQDLVITLPASFDEVARELTIKAAARAGLSRVVLIEEPQAAFYAWIYLHRDTWESVVSPGQKILVCDIGGGTTDFTLIRVRRAGTGDGDLHERSGQALSSDTEQQDRSSSRRKMSQTPGDQTNDGKIQFHRVAVGEHLILGGDNMDLALAHHLEGRLPMGPSGKLEPRQWSVLVRACRQAKETLLADDAPEHTTLTLPGSGSKLIGGAIQIEVTRAEAQQVLVDGFMPRVSLDEKPAARRSGFQEFGLPYATDAAMTRYLAAFLTAHRNVALDEGETLDHDPARPDVILFNGGVFNSSMLKKRLLEVIESWFGGGMPSSPDAKAKAASKKKSDAAWHPRVLEHARLDLAVAEGAAYYGMVCRGEGVRIAAGLARTYYLGVEGSGEQRALCLLPAGLEPGTDIELPQRFDLAISQPVEFPLFYSSVRLTDKPGELVQSDREQLTPLPPLRTVLQAGKKGEVQSIAVRVHARLTELGTLDLSCREIDGKRSWRLQFDVRSATQTDIEATEATAAREGVLDESVWEACAAIVADTFSPDGTGKPEELVKRLSSATGMQRNQWPSSLLRRFWEALFEHEAGRRRGAAYEARWLNLLGFSLRPGYGIALDDWRVAETWRVLQGKLIHATAACRAEWWILWRRVAGGLAAGRQQAIADPLLAAVRALHRQLTTGKGQVGDLNLGSHESAEIWRLLGSLELLDAPIKQELGGMMLDLLPKKRLQPVRGALAWALGRIGARAPFYGPLNTVVHVDKATAWIRTLMKEGLDETMVNFAIMQLARKTGDRYRDISEDLREKVLDWLGDRNAPRHFLELVRDGGRLDEEEQGLVFGESLPPGLRLG